MRVGRSSNGAFCIFCMIFPLNLFFCKKEFVYLPPNLNMVCSFSVKMEVEQSILYKRLIIYNPTTNMMKNYPQTRKSSWSSSLFSEVKRSILMGMLLSLLQMVLPMTAWAATTDLKSVIIEGKTFYVLRTSDDWDKFRQLVIDANGESDVNAIMDDDFTAIYSIGFRFGIPYRGTFDGNGHTLNVNINSPGSDNIAPFSRVKDVTIKNVHVTGTIKGGLHASGLICGTVNNPTINIERVWVSANISNSHTHLAGFLGHASGANVKVTDCLFDGSLTSTNSNYTYAGAFIGWGGSGSWTFHRAYENGTYSVHGSSGGFCRDSSGEKWWGYNSKSSLCVAAHNWGEMQSEYKSIANQETVVSLMNGEKAGAWQLVNGKAAPVMDTSPSDSNFETYDMFPGADEGDEGKVRLAYSCDKVMEWVEASYTDEYGRTKNLGRTTLAKNSYAGFLDLPATEAHRDLKLTVKLDVGMVNHTYNAKNDAVIHNARQLRATMLGLSGKELTDAGAVQLQWVTKDPEYKDLLEGDQFLVMRSLTGKMEDLENIGSVDLDPKKSTYTFKDSTLISALAAEQIDKGIGIPLVRYCLVRAATQQLWGIDKNPTTIFVQPQMATLTLLEPTNAKAAWSNEKERKVKVTWNYKQNDKSHNYVWDSRAEMKVEVQMFRRDGSRADSVVTELTEEQVLAGAAEVALSRSCVNYQIRLLVDGKESPIGKGTREIFAVLNSTEDYNKYAKRLWEVSQGTRQTAVPNAIMTNNILVNNDTDAGHYLGYRFASEKSAPFTGNFNGNGYKLTVNFPTNNTQEIDCMAPIMHVANGAVICNLTTAGTIKPYQKYAAGIVGQVDEGTVFIENSVSLVSLQTGLSRTNVSMGGLVGRCADGTNLFISNSKSNGSFGPRNTHAGGFGGIVGVSSTNGLTKIANSYSFIDIPEWALDGTYGDCYTIAGNAHLILTVIEDCLYHDGWDVNQGKRSSNTPDNECWSNGVPAVEQKAFSTPVSKTKTMVMLPADKFYYESLGKIDKESLKATSLQSSVLLEWKNVDESPVDYYEVWRNDIEAGEGFKCIATQLSEMQYEDTKTSPVHNYQYKVRGVNDCEGKTYEDTKVVDSHCVQTGTMEGFLHFADGTGIPGFEINITYGTQKWTAKTDESGFFRLTGLPYFNKTKTTYSVRPGNGYVGDTQSVSFDTKPGDNMVKGVEFIMGESVKFSGYVQYSGTSIPVQGVSFLVDGHEVHNASGKVVSDHEGKFAFRMTKDTDHKIQAVKDGHTFYQNGFYHEDDNENQFDYHFTTDKAGIYFYDETTVKLIGRVAGGKDQGDIPLGNSLSRNNLGDDLEMVLTLEGDNSSRLVWDIQDRNKKERDTVYVHKAHDKKHQYQTKVHTTLNRMVVKPDVYTGEYEVWLPPVKWKVQQITAKGYATLFQDGQMGDVIDLTDSLTEHADHYKGSWKNAEGVKVSDVDVSYYAQYNRIYHSPVLIDYQPIGYGKFDYFGDLYYNAKNLAGESEQVPLCYPVRKENWPENKKDSLMAVYTFGHPVFSIERNYPIKISAVEKYYYNNNTKSDTIDVIRLSGGEVIVHNSMVSSTHREVVPLDSVGEATYNLRASQTPYMLTGEDAVRTVNMTLFMDGTYYEAKPLKAYVLNQYVKAGAKDILSINKPMLIDVLRDPPGGGSSAKLSKGSTLKYAHDYSYNIKAGLNIGIGIGNAASILTAAGIGAIIGTISNAESKFSTDVDLIWTWTGKEAWSYTMTNNVDISTSSEKTMVGADADVYIGVETSYVMKPMVAIRAIPESMWKQLGGQRESGRMVEIATGYSAKGDTLHLVRDEMVGVGPKINSTFAHSQTYILKQLIPGLEEQCKSLMFTGTKAEAQKIADETGENVYWSLRTPDDPDFGVVNTAKEVELGDEKWEYYFNTSKDKAADGINYMVVRPSSNKDNTEDKVAEYCQSMLYWAAMIAQNEKEKLSATELVRSFDIDGGSPVSYSEDFTSDYSATGEIKNPLEGGLGKILSGALASLGRLISRNAHSQKINNLPYFGTQVPGYNFKMTFGPVFEYNISDPSSSSKKYNRKESFTISMDKKSHLVFDVYRAKTDVDDPDTSDGKYDIFVNRNYTDLVNTVKGEVTHSTNLPAVGEVKDSDLRFAKSFVYRTRGGATCRPYEGERTTNFYKAGTVLDERTKKIENPVIKMDKQSISGVPFGEPARFKLYLTNESEQPEAAYNFFDLYQVEKSNPKGAKLMVDGVPLTGNARTIEVRPGQVTEKTLEVYASEDFDYENLKISLLSTSDLNTFAEVSFDVHYLQTAGDIAITTPGDKWIMNTDAPQEAGKGWYMPVVIGGFNKNQHNFDHIEFQYKESTRGDDYWTNLCGYYADSTLYRAASGTKAMIPENGNIITRFFGEGIEMEKAYDLRAVLFCRNGNSFLTNSSKVLSGVKDTRRPQLFGTPEPKDGVLGAGDNLIFNFSEDIEYNYLQATTNFEVKGETNETSIQEAPSLLFTGGGYAQSEARRNFADKNVTIEVMIKPEDTGEEMPIFSHGSDGKKLQLWLTKDKKLKAIVDDTELLGKNVITTTGFQRVAMVLNNDSSTLTLFTSNEDETFKNVIYSGYGPIIFGSTNESNVKKRSFYTGRMLQGRVWNRAMNITQLDTYGNQLLSGYEMGLTDYYPMNDGEGDYANDFAQGAHLKLTGTDWAQPRGMSLRLDWAEERPVKGLKLVDKYFKRDDEQDYTLMFWFKTDFNGRGALFCNGSGYKTDVGAANSFFIGFESDTLKYRSNGKEYPLGTTFSDDRWHHYAMTVNRSHQVASIYVDNVMKAQFVTDALGGMDGDFYLGNMVWKEEGPHNDVVHQKNALTGNIDGIALFEQALPYTLIKRYTDKALGGSEMGLITYLDFERQERQKNGDITLQPYVLNKKVYYDDDGQPTERHDTVFVDPVADIQKRVDRNLGAPMQAYEELRNLKFSYVGRDNQILVNIDEMTKRVNKRTAYVTLRDIPDLNGNYMASPATAAVFIDLNPLRWTQKTYKATLSRYETEGQDYTFDINIVNNSGASHTYKVENMPKWLSVYPQTDVIEAKSEQTLTFTIGQDTNVGTYDDIIYLTDENGLAEPLALNLTLEGADPDWYVSDYMKQFSMSIVARVEIGNDIVTDSRDIVAVFDGVGRCMGIGKVNYDASSSESLVYLTVSDSLTVKRALGFRLWHYETGKMMVLSPPDTVYFEPETFVGTIKEPLVLRANDQYIQRIDLQPGWNWISLNVINDDYRKAKKLLSWFPWKEGDMLTDETNNISLLYHDGEWISNKGSKQLDQIRLSVSRSYRVKVGNYVKVELTGGTIQAKGDRIITVKQGWNSIGYTPLVNLPVATALADYLEEAEEGDVVKSKSSFAMFSKGAKGAREWKGNLKYLKPGEGYMLYRQKPTEVTFMYPFYEATTIFFEQPTSRRKAAADPYSSNMSLIAVAEGIELLEGDKLIAYARSEMVGEAPLTTDEDDEDTQRFYMTIAGDQNAPLSFAIEREGNIIATTQEVMTYEKDAVKGSYSEPTAISFVYADQLPQQGWYTLQGVRLPHAPTEKGVYIYNGRKHLVK